MKDSQGQEDSEGEYVITLQDGTPYLEVVSGLQKMVRRGKEREALTFALSLFDSGFGLALAKRLVMIATEDIGLAAPEVVSQVCTLSSTWILLGKESPRGMPEPLPLIMAVMLMCRSDKNREVDDSCVVMRETMRRGTGDSPKQVIQEWEDLVVDSHTSRGKQRLRLQATQRNIPYEQLAWHEFYQKGAVVLPLRKIAGNAWGHGGLCAVWT